MSTKKFLIITGIVFLPAIALLGYSQLSSVKAQNSEAIQHQETFLAHLDGSQEVPSVETDARGQYEIKSRKDTKDTHDSSSDSNSSRSRVEFPDAGGTVDANTINVDTTSSTGVDHVFVAPSSYHTIEGGKVSFMGSHFYPGEAVTIRRDNTILGRVSADASGRFQTVGYVMPYSSGTKEFTFVGSVSQIPFPVEVMVDGGDPWITLSTYYAGDRAPLTIKGHAFGSGEEVRVTFGGIHVGTVTANQSGEFSLNTRVPEGNTGSRTIQAHGLITGARVTERFSQAF